VRARGIPPAAAYDPPNAGPLRDAIAPGGGVWPPVLEAVVRPLGDVAGEIVDAES
jgi:hypothetical protein